MTPLSTKTRANLNRIRQRRYGKGSPWSRPRPLSRC